MEKRNLFEQMNTSAYENSTDPFAALYEAGPPTQQHDTLEEVNYNKDRYPHQATMGGPNGQEYAIPHPDRPTTQQQVDDEARKDEQCRQLGIVANKLQHSIHSIKSFIATWDPSAVPGYNQLPGEKSSILKDELIKELFMTALKIADLSKQVNAASYFDNQIK